MLASPFAIEARAQGTPSAAQVAAPSSPAPAAAPAAAAVPPQPPPPSDYKPGFLHQMKVWWDDSLSVFDGKPKTASGTSDAANSTASTPTKTDSGAVPATSAETNPGGDVAKGAASVTQDAVKKAVDATKGVADTATDAMKNAVEATKNAADALVRLPGTRIIDIRETCAKAPNGASDCAAAAATGCRAKGFAGGSALDVRTADKCDAKPRAGVGLSDAVACRSEAVVIRAVCN
jgi:hypothetical protein